MIKSDGDPVNHSNKLDPIVSVGPHSLREWRELRLRGLREHPEALHQTVESFQATTDEQTLARMQAQQAIGGFVLAAVSKTGQMLGTVGLALDDAKKTSHRGMLWGMYVIPEARGQDIGRRLVTELLARAEKIQGLEQIHLAVVTTNQAALALYTKLGFSVYGTDPRVLKIGEQYFDEHLMVLRMSRSTTLAE